MHADVTHDLPRSTLTGIADEKPQAPRRFLIDVEETIRIVLEQEDTDGDFQVPLTLQSVNHAGLLTSLFPRLFL